MADQTTFFNTQFARSVLFELEVGSVVTIDGTVTIPAGKVLKFKPGGKLTGTGTINGGIISAHKLQHIFDTTLAVNPQGSTDNVFSGRWFGAHPDEVDNQPFLQKAIDTCLANQLPKLYIPCGQYDIAKGLLIHRGNNLQTQICLYGDQKGLLGFNTQTIINCTHADNFGLGVYIGKNAVFENFGLRGINQLNYSQTVAYTHATTYLTGGARDNRYSPYAGIVIDPFHSSITGSDRYPGFESYYAGSTAIGGSTACIFRNIEIDGFTVARVLSPNGTSQNNESHVFEGCWIANCREGYASCNSQERNITIKHELIWNSVKTCYITNKYGAQNGDPPLLYDINIAGNIYEFVHWPNSGFGSYFKMENVHTEALYRIGTIQGQTKISECKFHFADPYTTAGLDIQPWILQVGGQASILFDTCQIYCYNDVLNFPMRISSTEVYQPHMISFVNSKLTPPSFTGDFVGGEEYGFNAFNFIGCKFYQYDGKLGNNAILTGFTDYSIYYSSNWLLNVGNEIMYNAGSSVGSTNKFFLKHKIVTPYRRTTKHTAAVTITRSGATATFDITGTPELSGVLKVGDGIWANTMGGQFGRIQGISGNTVTIEALVEGFVTGNYAIYTTFIQYLKRPFIGNITSGSNVITDVLDTGNWIVGDRIGSMKNGGILPGSYITVISGTNVTVSNNFAFTANDVIISQYDYEESGLTHGNPISIFAEGISCRKGTVLTEIDPSGTNIEWVCTKSGVFGTANLPVFVNNNYNYLDVGQ